MRPPPPYSVIHSTLPIAQRFETVRKRKRDTDHLSSLLEKPKTPDRSLPTFNHQQVLELKALPILKRSVDLPKLVLQDSWWIELRHGERSSSTCSRAYPYGSLHQREKRIRWALLNSHNVAKHSLWQTEPASQPLSKQAKTLHNLSYDTSTTSDPTSHVVRNSWTNQLRTEDITLFKKPEQPKMTYRQTSVAVDSSEPPYDLRVLPVSTRQTRSTHHAAKLVSRWKCLQRAASPIILANRIKETLQGDPCCSLLGDLCFST